MDRRFRAKLVLTVVMVAVLACGGAWAGPPPGKGPGTGGGGKKEKVDHTARQERPISLGTSGGSVVDLANGYCCSGTLGALVQDGSGNQYILSNAHVFAGDIVSGGNSRSAAVGDPINQPGYIDVGCQDLAADYVATLSDWVPLGSGTVDAAIAEVADGAVDPAGSILEIGTISSTTAAAYIDQAVKKSGRTSGLTKGKVAALNVDVSVQYSDECAGNYFVTSYSGQILVTPGKFLKSGDSGSLMVENVGTDPQPVGLLYAGSKRVAVAHPIDEVLGALGVDFVGVATASAGGATADDAAVDKASKAKSQNSNRLLRVPGAVGHGVGRSGQSGRIVIKLLVDEITPAAQRQYPREVDGVAVELMDVGTIVAY